MDIVNQKLVKYEQDLEGRGFLQDAINIEVETDNEGN